MDIKQFRGLNNVSDPMRLDMTWLVQADNVNVVDSGGVTKRAGYVLSRSGAFTSAYSTLDFTRLYMTTDLGIQNFTGENLVNLNSSEPMYWAEVNEHVFFNNGIDRGIILPDDSVIPWGWSLPDTPALTATTGNLPAGTYMVCCTGVLPDGRETGAGEAVTITLMDGQALQISGLTLGCNVYIAPANSDVFQLHGQVIGTALTFNSSPDTLGRDLLNSFLDPLPEGATVIQHWKGRMYAAHYSPAENQTALWFSEPLGFHLFNLNSGFLLVPGEILALIPHADALIIGTDAKVFSYTTEKIEQIADYGLVPGKSWDIDGERVLIWTRRGLCAAFPFQNLTERQVSVAPGTHVAGCLVRAGGQKRFVAAIQQGGEVFNARA